MGQFPVLGEQSRLGPGVANGAKALGHLVRGWIIGVNIADEGGQERETPVARGAGGFGGEAVPAMLGRKVPAKLRLPVVPFDCEMDKADGRARVAPFDGPEAVAIQHPAAGVIGEFLPGGGVGIVERAAHLHRARAGIKRQPERQVRDAGRAQAQALGRQNRDAGGVEGGGLGGGTGRGDQAAGGHAAPQWR
jgi:hypothetical protein